MMKKFVIEKDFFEIFPDAYIGVLICRGIDNRVRDPESTPGILKSHLRKRLNIYRILNLLRTL